ncbi:MAG TPA: hypothetical protein VJ830_03945 [Anaerolineales bacterium]|nr:hypothetical protein [Anaerolineales bacterium]
MMVTSRYGCRYRKANPETYFKPPYVGTRGWVGIELDQISDKDLTFHIQTAWELIAPKQLLSHVKSMKQFPDSMQPRSRN